jgi:hypothetical protein
MTPQRAIAQRSQLVQLFTTAERNGALSADDIRWAWAEWKRLTAVINAASL